MGSTVSSFGNWINFIGLNLLIYNRFGSGKILGLFLVVRMLPAILFGSFGGYLADRYNRKRIMLLCDTLRAGLVISLLFVKDIYTFFFLGFLLSAIDKIFMASYTSFIPDIVKKENLLDANALLRISRSVIMVLGPSVGAVLVTFYSYNSVFLIDASTFLVSIFFLLIISPETTSHTEKKTILAEFGKAFAFFKGHSLLLFLFFIRLADALGSGAYNTNLPVLSKIIVGGRGGVYGWLVGMWSFGELIGAFLSKKLAKKNIPIRTLFSSAIILMALGMGLTFRYNLYIALLFIWLGGIGDGIGNVLFNTLLMRETPNEIRGKVFGVVMTTIQSAVALGMAVSGFLTDQFGMKTVTAGASLFIILAVLCGNLWNILTPKDKSSAPPPNTVV